MKIAPGNAGELVLLEEQCFYVPGIELTEDFPNDAITDLDICR